MAARDGQATSDEIADAHQWRGCLCTCGQDVNSPRGFTRHVLEVARHDFLVRWRDEQMTIQMDLQAIGRALDLRPGTYIAGPEGLAAIEQLKADRAALRPTTPTSEEQG